MAASKERPNLRWSEVLRQEKVSGAGDRQELGETLHDPEEYGFE